MSSENRLIAWNILERDVPPLKRSRPERASIEKICFSTQQTQKSFSIMASGKTFRSAVSANKSARSRAGIWATLFTRFSPRSFSLLHRSSPHRTAYPSQVGVSQQWIALTVTSRFRAGQSPACPDDEETEPRARTFLPARPSLSGERV